MSSGQQEKKRSLREAEDKVQELLKPYEDDEPMKALIYRILYRQGMRIDSAEKIISKEFSTKTD